MAAESGIDKEKWCTLSVRGTKKKRCRVKSGKASTTKSTKGHEENYIG
jgi:hypothetical protein